MSYTSSHLANVNAASHILIADAIVGTFDELAYSLGEANALDVLKVLLTRFVNEKQTEGQSDGALNLMLTVQRAFQDHEQNREHAISVVNEIVADTLDD